MCCCRILSLTRQFARPGNSGRQKNDDETFNTLQLSRYSQMLLLPLAVPRTPAPAMLHTKSFPRLKFGGRTITTDVGNITQVPDHQMLPIGAAQRDVCDPPWGVMRMWGMTDNELVEGLGKEIVGPAPLDIEFS